MNNKLNGSFFNIVNKPKVTEVNLYADEVQEIECPYTKEKWIYIGLLVERLDNPLLEKIISIRYMNNFDINSPYFEKNDRIIHWAKIRNSNCMHEEIYEIKQKIIKLKPILKEKYKVKEFDFFVK
jgi:hypothetical protein